MSFCPRCGVETGPGIDNCPLCKSPVTAELTIEKEPGAEAFGSGFPFDTISTPNPANEFTTKQKHILITSLLIFLGVFPIVITIGINFVIQQAITWSFYVLVPLLGLMAFLSLLYIHRVKTGFIVQIGLFEVLVMHFLILLRISAGAEINAGQIFSNIQFTLYAIAAVEVFLIGRKIFKPKLKGLLVLILGILSVFLCGIDYRISGNCTWSIIAAACLLSIVSFVVFLIIAKKKGLNSVGFICLDIMFLLLLINYGALGTITWSLITSIIFFPAALFFYSIDALFFKNTDWKKALHL